MVVHQVCILNIVVVEQQLVVHILIIKIVVLNIVKPLV